MKKITTNIAWLLFLIIFTFFGCNILRKSVLFGEHSKNNGSDYYSIFIDAYGAFYPEHEISNRQLRKNYDKLEIYYKNNPEELIKEGNYKNFDEFQKALIENIASSINKKVDDGKYESITFILVGYNNKYKSSEEKLFKLKDKINGYLETVNKKTFIVPIFWDGKAGLFGFDYLSIYDNANANSYNAGLELRLIVNKLKSNKLNFISHSLGANVITQLLFNQIAKVEDDSKLGDLSIKNNLERAYNNSEYITTKKEIRVGIIAPAIPGISTFEDYDKRGYDFDKSKDNYMFYVGYNEYDPALTKVVKKLSKHLSSTTLGCNYKNEVSKVLDHYKTNYDFTKIDTLNFSIKNGKKHRKHGILSYMELAEYDKLLESIFK